MDAVASFRKGRLDAAMARRDVDVLIASSPDCIAYLSGYDPFVPRFLHTAENYCVYAPQTGKRILVCGVSEVPSGVEAAAFDAIYTFGTFYFHIPECNEPFQAKVQAALACRYGSVELAVSAAVHDVCGHAARIAIEEHRASIAVWKQLECDFGAEHILRGAAILLDAKMIKHPEEQKQLAAAARLADDAFYQMAYEIRIGMSEAELYERYCSAVLQRHAWPHFCVATADSRSAFVDTQSSSMQLVQRGSVLRFDFGCRLGGYYSDIARMAVVGRNEKAEAYYRSVREGVMEGIRAARPGVSAGEVFEVMVTAVQKGIPHYRRNHTGHGIGFTMYDAPAIAPGNDTLLEAGMVLCLETPYYEVGWGGVMLEETILIGEDETICLSGGPRDLLVLDI